MENIRTPLMLDTGTIIATLSVEGITASLETNGEIVVLWSETLGRFPEKRVYTYPSQFPEQLKEVLRSPGTTDPRLTVVCAPWFEFFCEDSIMPDFEGDPEGCGSDEIYQMLYRCICEYVRK